MKVDMNKTIVVVKFGSELLSDDSGIMQSAIDGYARGLSHRLMNGHKLIVVTSGAVSAGAGLVRERGVKMQEYQSAVLAQLGCAAVTRAWEIAFAKLGILAGGLLVTHHQLSAKKEGGYFTQHLLDAAALGVVSIINENDALSDIELMQLAAGGDNDGLARHIAASVGAAELVLFTKDGGIVDETGRLIAEVTNANIRQIEQMLAVRSSSKKATGRGRGGIVSKFAAAKAAAQAGIATKIAAADHDMTGNNATEFVVG